MTARRRGREPRDRARRAIRGIAAATAAVVLSLGTAIAADADATPAPTPTAPPEPVSLTLSPVSDGVVPSGDPLAVSFTISNPTDLYEPSTGVTLELGSRPLTTRATLDAWLGGDLSGVPTRQVASATTDAVGPAETTTVGAVVGADDPAIRGLKPGVYPLLARADRAAGDLVSTSVMIVPRDTPEATPVGVVVPITAGPLTEGLLDAEQLEALTAPGGGLRDVLDAVSGTAAILAVDPAIPAAIRVLGDAAPESATIWLDDLMGLANARFALQFGDADVAAQLGSGLRAPLQPTSLLAYMSAPDFPLPTETPEPTAGPEDETPEEAALPDLETLLDIGTARPGVYWPVGGTADAAVVGALGSLGDDEDPSLTLIPSASTAPATATIPARTRVGDAATLTYDSGISGALREASETSATALRGRELASAVAMIELASATAQDAPLLVTVDRGTARSRLALRAAIDAATVLDTTRAAAFGELVSAKPQAARVTAAAVDEARASAASLLHDEEGDISAFASILDDPNLLTGPQRAEVLQVLGSGWVPTPEAWRAAVAEHRDATVATLDSVGILPPSNINLATSGSSLPFWVRNDLPYPVNVVLYAIPDDLRLDVRRATPIDGAEASSNTKVFVPVQARVGNGEVTIQLQLRSATSVPIGASRDVDVNVRADWEGIGVAVILVLVAGLVVLGLVRTILRRRGGRKSRKSGDAAATADEPDVTS